MTEKRRGTRCKVCTFCGACFADDASAGKPSRASAPAVGAAEAWSGHRCEVCRGCGKCLEAWGLIGADAESGATSWAEGFKKMDDGTAGAPPAVLAAPGAAPSRSRSPFATLKAGTGDADTSTGATPGVSSACKELGLDDPAAVIANLGIKPPGVA